MKVEEITFDPSYIQIIEKLLTPIGSRCPSLSGSQTQFDVRRYDQIMSGLEREQQTGLLLRDSCLGLDLRAGTGS